MLKLKNKIFIILILISFTLVNLYISKSKPNKEKEKVSRLATDSEIKYFNNLKDSVEYLEKKAEILNRYLQMKHIEYIDVCKLTYKINEK
jgi:hypothetical protein